MPMSLQRDVAGTGLTALLMLGTRSATIPAAEREPGVPGEWALDHRLVAALINPAAQGK